MYSETIHYLLSIYAKSDMINETENAVRRLRQHRFSIQEYADELSECALKCGDVFEGNEHMGISVEGMKSHIRRIVQHYWSTYRYIRMHA